MGIHIFLKNNFKKDNKGLCHAQHDITAVFKRFLFFISAQISEHKILI
jgi:hypothetical protein